MDNDTALASRNLELGFEFSRYVLAHPELALPDDAVVFFEVEDDSALTAYNRRLSQRTRETGQPVVTVRIKSLAPSRLIEPHVITDAG